MMWSWPAARAVSAAAWRVVTTHALRGPGRLRVEFPAAGTRAAGQFAVVIVELAGEGFDEVVVLLDSHSTS